MTRQLTAEEQKQLAKLKHLRSHFPTFANECLKIRAKKGGSLVPFKLNQAQLYVHEKLEQQKREKGWVRALILKGRQQGISTYVGGRGYHRSSMRRGVNVYILSHEQTASDSLFKIVDRYHTNNPLKPHTGASNVKELEFDRLDSSYSVATAGQKAGGRGKTISFFHGSEVAFWANDSDHFAASVQAVPLERDTEIILESTANGVTGEFFERWQDAEAGKGDYIAIFVPWYWSDEYSREVDDDFELNPEPEDGELSEVEYAEMYGLTLEQMAWRRAKIAELRSLKKFKQEYPAEPSEAFQSSGEDTMIDPVTVLRARKRRVEPAGPLIMGCDPAGPGGDRFAVAFRRSFCVEKVIWRDKIETADAHQWLLSLIRKHQPERLFIDTGGIGYATCSLLRAEGREFARLVKPVNFGSTSEFKRATPHMAGPKNRRAEMWVRMKEWLELPEGVQIPDLDVLQSDLISARLKPTLTNDTLLLSKEEMRKLKIRSPDLADAIALTFASLTNIKNESAKPKPKFGDDRVPVSTPPEYGFDPEADGGPNGWMG